MNVNNLNWKIGGEAGEGIMVTGLIFAKTCSNIGLNILDYPEYPSRIRGGHNCYQVRVKETKPITTEVPVDILIALNKETVDLHLKEMSNDGVIVVDAKVPLEAYNYNRFFSVPMDEFALKAGGKITKNNVSLGITFAMLGLAIEELFKTVTAVFSEKGEKVLEMNKKAIELGYNYTKEHFNYSFPYKLEPKSIKPKYVITGNEAIALGAVKAGLKLFAAYPMTPASSILHFLAPLAKDYRILVKHTEDEIAAVLTTIGANYAGVRAMTATSGGGFSLMTEGLGMAAITETPLVIAECQRPGPSTGMPTWTEQGDLRFVMHASQGDFLRVVLSPGDVAEAYNLTQVAFNLAEKYQIPVIILSDKLLAESHESIDDFTQFDVPIERGKIAFSPDERYKRYDLSYQDGISYRAFPPSQNGMHLANSDEHDEYGLVSEESEVRNAMQRKRFAKLALLRKELPKPKLYGKDKADISFISFGSTKNVILVVMELLRNKGIDANFLHCLCPLPLNTEDYDNFVKNAKRLICVENNYTAQFASILQENLCVEIKEKDRLLKSDGRPFFPDEIVNFVTR